MKIIESKDESSFYETFSDLIFCCLVLFVFIVLVLVVSIDDRVQKVAQAEDNVLKTAKVVDEEKTELRNTSQLLSQIVFEHRYTGRSGQTTFAICADVESDPIKIWPIPYDLLSDYSTDRYGETVDERKKRQKDVLLELEQIIQNVAPLQHSEFKYFLNKVASGYWTLGENETNNFRFGFEYETEQSGLRISSLSPDCTLASKGIYAGDTIIKIDNTELGEKRREEAQSILEDVKKKSHQGVCRILLSTHGKAFCLWT